MSEDFLPEYLRKRYLILGCGSTLFGDDGFGPAVAKYLRSNIKLPEDVYVLDAGTGVKDILLSVALSEVRPERIILVDSLNLGGKPGTIAEISIEDLPAEVSGNYSLHNFPTRKLLAELRDVHGVGVNIITCQVGGNTQNIEIGLSKPVERAVPRVAKMILEKLASR